MNEFKAGESINEPLPFNPSSPITANLKQEARLFKIGDKVLKYSGDYQLPGVIVSVFNTTAGKLRFVVEHEPGFLHIYSEANIKHMENK